MTIKWRRRRITRCPDESQPSVKSARVSRRDWQHSRRFLVASPRQPAVNTVERSGETPGLSGMLHRRVALRCAAMLRGHVLLRGRMPLWAVDRSGCSDVLPLRHRLFMGRGSGRLRCQRNGQEKHCRESTQ
jgi:hypothetical protein